jgi:hypothetical protein
MQIHPSSVMTMHMMLPEQLVDLNHVQEFPRELPLPRIGKWTTEEEMYAYVVVECFRLGSLPDCDNNCTLRKYLSRKLGCTGMRISKKYGPDLYGQVCVEVFLRGFLLKPFDVDQDTYLHKELIEIKLYQMIRLRALFIEAEMRKLNKNRRGGRSMRARSVHAKRDEPNRKTLV